MRLFSLSRSVRRLFSSSTSFLTNSTPPKKHLKIDDEESLLPTEYALHPTHFSPLYRMLKMLLYLILLLLMVFFFVAYIIYMPPTWVINIFQTRHPDVIFHLPLPPGQRVVALTIDDAPSQYTPKLLEVLAKHNATATFFAIGNQICCSDIDGKAIIQQMHDQGHEVGNHAMFDEPSIKLPPEVLWKQILDTEKMLGDNLGNGNKSGFKWFRPGSGVFNRKMVEMMTELGYTMVLGSVYPHDAQLRWPGFNARHVVRRVSSGGVIIMHDRRGHSVEQLSLTLEGLAKKGYRAVSVGELVKIHDEYAKGVKGR